MYEAFFHLKRRPFAATPDPQCFLASSPIKGALDELVVCVEQGQGISIVSAPAGTGKTLLCERLRLELQDRFACVMLRHASFLTRRALLQTILFELNQSYSRPDEQELRLELLPVLRSLRPQRESLVLLCDEAHLLSEDLLEELRIMSDLSEQGRPLVRLVLVGQPSLEETLAAPGLEAFNQRIRAHVAMDAMDRMGTLDYIDYRITWAGGRTNELFQPESLNLICRASDGVPRCVNQLCDHSLLLAFVAEESPVGPQLIREALRDLRQLPLHWNESLLNDQPRSDEGSVPRDPVYTEEPSNHFTPNADHGSYEPSAYETASHETASYETDPAGTSSIEIGGDSAPMLRPFPVHAEGAASLLTASANRAVQTTGLHDNEGQHDEVDQEHDDDFSDESTPEESRGHCQTNESMTTVPSGLADIGDSRTALDAVMTQLEQMRRGGGFGIGRLTGGGDEGQRSVKSSLSRRTGFFEETVIDRYAAIDGGFALPVDSDQPAETTDEPVEPTTEAFAGNAHQTAGAIESSSYEPVDTGLTKEVHSADHSMESLAEYSAVGTGNVTEEIQFPMAGARNMDELVQQIADAIAKEVRESAVMSQSIAGSEADSTTLATSDSGFSDVCSRLGNMLPETTSGLCWDADSIRRALTSSVAIQDETSGATVDSHDLSKAASTDFASETFQTPSTDFGIRDRAERVSSEEQIGTEVCDLADLTGQTIRGDDTSTPDYDRLRAELGCEQRPENGDTPPTSDSRHEAGKTDRQEASTLWCRSTSILRESAFTNRESELQAVETVDERQSMNCSAGTDLAERDRCSPSQPSGEEAHPMRTVAPEEASPDASVETPEPSSPPAPRSYRNLFSMLRRKQQNLL